MYNSKKIGNNKGDGKINDSRSEKYNTVKNDVDVYTYTETCSQYIELKKQKKSQIPAEYILLIIIFTERKKIAL